MGLFILSVENLSAVPTRFTCAGHQYIYCRLFAHCTECTEYILPEFRCALRTNTECKGDNHFKIIHVRTVAAVQTDTFADIIIVQDVFFEDGFDTRMYRSGGRAEQFDYFRFRHPYITARYNNRIFADCDFISFQAQLHKSVAI